MRKREQKMKQNKLCITSFCTFKQLLYIFKYNDKVSKRNVFCSKTMSNFVNSASRLTLNQSMTLLIFLFDDCVLKTLQTDLLLTKIKSILIILVLLLLLGSLQLIIN